MYKHPSEMWESESQALRGTIRAEREAKEDAQRKLKDALLFIGLIANSSPQREIRIPNHLIEKGMPENTRLITFENHLTDEYVIAVEDIEDELPR